MQHNTHPEETVEKTSGMPVIGVAIILAILAIFLLTYFKNDATGVNKGNIWDIKNRDEMKGEGEAHADAAPMLAPESLGKLDSTSGNFIYNVGASAQLKLPDSTFITAGENSTEAKLIKFFSDASLTVDTLNKSNGWISCDRLYFETGKSTITSESQNQIKNIAAILKAFPVGMVKIGGYTDSTGNAEANKRLSDMRANAALTGLVKLGISAERLKAVGYGSEHSILTNTTADGRALNRRIDLRITKK